MPDPLAGDARSGEERMADALRPFGWEMGDEFWRRYHSDPWVFNLANAVERLTGQINEAQNNPEAVLRALGGEKLSVCDDPLCGCGKRRWMFPEEGE